MAMPEPERKQNAGRAPIRANGVKRREALLEAAAAIISEQGVAGLTLHATARRAKASVGSTYHFFSDRGELLEALRDRHSEAIGRMLENAFTLQRGHWIEMSTHDVVGALFGKPIGYYSENPSALELHSLREGKAIDDFIALVRHVMCLRLGPVRGPAAAEMLFAVSTGTLSFIVGAQRADSKSLIEQIPSVLVAYLQELEEHSSRTEAS